MNRQLTLICATLLLLIAAYFFTQTLQDYPPGTSYDESVNIVDAGLVLQSGKPQMLLYDDPGRPEVMYRYFLTLIAWGGGQSVFVFRLGTVFLGLLGVAAAGGAGRAFFLGKAPVVGRLALLAAMASLVISPGFLTHARGLYRGVTAVLFCLLYLTLVWRGLHLVLSGKAAPTSRRALSYFGVGGMFGGLIVHTYTAANFGAVLLPVLVGHLLVLRWRRWRAWSAGVVMMGLGALPFLAPFGYVLMTNSELVLSRSHIVANVENRADLKELALLQDFTYLSTHEEITLNRYLNRGDANPQYNSDQAPLMPRGTTPLFYLGVLVCLGLLWRYEATQVLALLVVSVVPITLSNEYFHGLRMILGYAVVPLLCAAAVGGLVWGGHRLIPSRLFGGLAMVVGLLLTFYVAAESAAVFTRYRAFFDDYNAALQPRRPDEFSQGEWYFRPQNRDSAAYVRASGVPTYMSIADMDNAFVRGQFQQQYPHTRTWVDLPTDAQGRLMLPEGQVYAVVDLGAAFVEDFRVMVYLPIESDTLYILPPLTDESEQKVRARLINGEGVLPQRESNQAVGRVFSTGNIEELFTFAPIQPANGVIFDQSLQVVGYTAPPELRPGQENSFCLIWQPARETWRRKWAEIELWQGDYVGLSGQEGALLFWLYPTSLWQKGDLIPSCYRLLLPADAQPGLYWLAAGVFEPLRPFAPAFAATGHSLNAEKVPVAALKVPQSTPPPPPTNTLEALFSTPQGVTLTLLGYDLDIPDFAAGDRLNINLYWQSSAPTAAPYTIFVQLLDGTGALVAQQDSQPWDGRYPTTIWSATEVVQTQHQVSIPTDAIAPFKLIVGMYDPLTFARLPIENTDYKLLIETNHD